MEKTKPDIQAVPKIKAPKNKKSAKKKANRKITETGLKPPENKVMEKEAVSGKITEPERKPTKLEPKTNPPENKETTPNKLEIPAKARRKQHIAIAVVVMVLIISVSIFPSLKYRICSMKMAYSFSDGENLKYDTTSQAIIKIDGKDKDKELPKSVTALFKGYFTLSGRQRNKNICNVAIERKMSESIISVDGKTLPRSPAEDEQQATEIIRINSAGEIMNLENFRGDPGYERERAEKILFYLGFIPMPDKNMRIGDSWSGKVNLESISDRFIKTPLKGQIRYTIEDAVRKNGTVCAVIGFKGKFPLIAGDSHEGISAGITGRITYRGRIFFDVKTGTIMESKRKLKLEMEKNLETGSMVSTSADMDVISILTHKSADRKNKG